MHKLKQNIRWFLFHYELLRTYGNSILLSAAKARVILDGGSKIHAEPKHLRTGHKTPLGSSDHHTDSETAQTANVSAGFCDEKIKNGPDLGQ